VAVVEKALANVRADEARAAGDEKIHGCTLNYFAPKEQWKLASHKVAGLVQEKDLRSGGTLDFPMSFQDKEIFPPSQPLGGWLISSVAP